MAAKINLQFKTAEQLIDEFRGDIIIQRPTARLSIILHVV